MNYPYTDDGYNMYDLISMLQKAIRRCDYENAGFAANQLKKYYRKIMWNRLLVISAEDCFGIITKEIEELKKNDEKQPSEQNISNAVALLCRTKKSRDACYFACNFILVTRRPREIEPTKKYVENLYKRLRTTTSGGNIYDSSGFMQMSLFDTNEYGIPEKDVEKFKNGASLQIAISHRDMDMIGVIMEEMRHKERSFLWEIFEDYAKNYTDGSIVEEILSLMNVDCMINEKKKDKDEIFISKAAILLCQCNDERFESLLSCDVVYHSRCIDWSTVRTKPISECILKNGEMPIWVFDCHTIKGKQMGKTDWDMTSNEQEALTPLQLAYFDDASWIYIYEQDYQKGLATERQMIPIREFAKTHPANPVEYIPYE